MMEKFQNRYRIPSARLQGYDYGSNGFYFVTICTKNRECFFGSIVETGNNFVETGNSPSLRPTIIGQTAIDFWTEIPEHYPFLELDEFVVMPNHIHGILFFNKNTRNSAAPSHWQPNKFGVQSQNLGAVIRAYKSTTKRFANQNNIEFEWQSRYHDRIIRNEKELNAIRQYIINNPLKWGSDVLNVTNVETGNDGKGNMVMGNVGMVNVAVDNGIGDVVTCDNGTGYMVMGNVEMVNVAVDNGMGNVGTCDNGTGNDEMGYMVMGNVELGNDVAVDNGMGNVMANDNVAVDNVETGNCPSLHQTIQHQTIQHQTENRFKKM